VADDVRALQARGVEQREDVAGALLQPVGPAALGRAPGE
jgi:hypothetical protein